MASRSRWMPPARSTALKTSTGQARPQPSPRLHLGLRAQRHPSPGLTNLCAFLWHQEVCPSVLCVWWCHHARARPGGDGAHRGPGPQFPYRMLQVRGQWEALGAGVKGTLLAWISGWQCCCIFISFSRSVECYCPLKGSAGGATRWTDTSCARHAVPGAFRSSRPPSPLTVENPPDSLSLAKGSLLFLSINNTFEFPKKKNTVHIVCSTHTKVPLASWNLGFWNGSAEKLGSLIAGPPPHIHCNTRLLMYPLEFPLLILVPVCSLLVV